MFRKAIFAVLLAASPATADDHDHDHHVAQEAGIRAVHAWTNATRASTALVFVDITNSTDAPVNLIGAKTDIAASARLVALENAGGVLGLQPIPHMPVPAGTTVHLGLDGLAIELASMTTRLTEGAHFDLHLLFDGIELPVVVEIESETARQHSHAGHAH